MLRVFMICLVAIVASAVSVLEGSVGSKYVQSILNTPSSQGGCGGQSCEVAYVEMDLMDWQTKFKQHLAQPIPAAAAAVASRHRRSVFL